MKRFLKVLAPLLALLAAAALLAQDAPPAAAGGTGGENEGTTLPDYIAQIAEKEDVGAGDFFNMAGGTLQVATAITQQGGKMPESVLLDALDAVAEGRDLDPAIGDWDDLESRLLELLEPPEEEQQQEDSSEQEEQSEDGEQESGSQDSSQNGENSEQGESESQEGQEPNSSEQQQDSENGESEPGQPDGETEGEGQEGELPKPTDGARMGELGESEEPQEVQLDGSPESQGPPPEQMQTLGGQSGNAEPIAAKDAALRQMLEQLKQQDEPGKLYQILQEAQNGGKQETQPNTKDW